METCIRKKDITVIGAAIMDVLAGPASSQVFQTGTQPMERIRLSFGGDALNEAVALSRLGKRAELVSKVGKDEAGARILDYLKENGISPDCIRTEEGLETGINIVLIDETGERHFLTNPNGSLRKLAEADVEPYLDEAADIVSFASIFVSPVLDIPAMERVFRRVKARSGRILAADMIEATKTNAGTRKLPMTEDVFRCFQAIIEDREKPRFEKMVDGHTGFLFTDKDGMSLVAMHWEH